MTRRSVLFTPGNRADMMRKSLRSDADVVVFDLEDAVPPDGKDEAREAVRDVLEDIDKGELDETEGGSEESDVGSDVPEVSVRINPLDSGGEMDIQYLDPAPDAVVLPKVGGESEIQELIHILDGHDLNPAVFALIESAAGVLHADEICGAGVDALVFGAEDYAADVGATRTSGGEEVSYARQKVVAAASSHGADSIDTLYTDYGDTEGLREDIEYGITLGYDGKLAIHPRQVGVINKAYTPEDEKVEWAEKVLEKNEEVGGGVFEVEGEMIDGPLVKQAERIMERVEASEG
ncbi:MAG: CoA ester lyase [Halobacteria archaeon]